MKRKAVKRNIRNTQRGRRGTSSRAPARPAGHRRAGPGERGGGRFFQVEMAPASRFITFRYTTSARRGRRAHHRGSRERWSHPSGCEGGNFIVRL
jgi:hypothetical protein